MLAPKCAFTYRFLPQNQSECNALSTDEINNKNKDNRKHNFDVYTHLTLRQCLHVSVFNFWITFSKRPPGF